MAEITRGQSLSSVLTDKGQSTAELSEQIQKADDRIMSARTQSEKDAAIAAKRSLLEQLRRVQIEQVDRKPYDEKQAEIETGYQDKKANLEGGKAGSKILEGLANIAGGIYAGNRGISFTPAKSTYNWDADIDRERSDANVAQTQNRQKLTDAFGEQERKQRSADLNYSDAMDRGKLSLQGLESDRARVDNLTKQDTDRAWDKEKFSQELKFKYDELDKRNSDKKTKETEERNAEYTAMNDSMGRIDDALKLTFKSGDITGPWTGGMRKIFTTKGQDLATVYSNVNVSKVLEAAEKGGARVFDSDAEKQAFYESLPTANKNRSVNIANLLKMKFYLQRAMQVSEDMARYKAAGGNSPTYRSPALNLRPAVTTDGQLKVIDVRDYDEAVDGKTLLQIDDYAKRADKANQPSIVGRGDIPADVPKFSERALSSKDRAMLDWAKQNPDTEEAKRIFKVLGVTGH